MLNMYRFGEISYCRRKWIVKYIIETRKWDLMILEMLSEYDECD